MIGIANEVYKRERKEIAKEMQYIEMDTGERRK